MNTLRELRKRHDVTVLAFYRGHREEGYERALAAEFPGAEAVWLGRGIRSSLQYRLRSRRHSVVLMSYGAPDRARRRTAELLNSGHFDVAVADFVFAASNFPARLPIPCVILEHNVEWQLLASQAAVAGGASLIERWAFRKLRRFEADQVRRFHHTFAVSAEDATGLRELAPDARMTVLSTGVDGAEYRASPLPSNANPVVMFTGMMSYFPNVDAMRWFCSEIWPRVLQGAPGARLRIVGRDPSAAVRALASETVEVTGRVDSVAEHLGEASVVVVPLRAGSGTRLKIFEALASGRPMVSTRLGAEGLELRDGHDVVFAEEADQFAREVVSLLSDRARAEALGAAAAETAGRHTWGRVADGMEEILTSLVAERSAARPGLTQR